MSNNSHEGIKVRLVTGQIGRVQSLSYGDETNRSASVGEDSVGGGVLPPPSTGSSHRRRDNANSRHETSRKGRSRAERGECSQPPAANESVSLLDYVQRPRATPSSGTKSAGPASVPVQEQLEVDYPSLDSALIAAILVDYPNVEEARTVLASLG